MITIDKRSFPPAGYRLAFSNQAVAVPCSLSSFVFAVWKKKGDGGNKKQVKKWKSRKAKEKNSCRRKSEWEKKQNQNQKIILSPGLNWVGSQVQASPRFRDSPGSKHKKISAFDESFAGARVIKNPSIRRRSKGIFPSGTCASPPTLVGW